MERVTEIQLIEIQLMTCQLSDTELTAWLAGVLSEIEERHGEQVVCDVLEEAMKIAKAHLAERDAAPAG